MSVVEDCGTIRRALPRLVHALVAAGRPAPDRWDDESPDRRRWLVPTRLADGRLARVVIRTVGGNGILVEVGVWDGGVWSTDRVWRSGGRFHLVAGAPAERLIAVDVVQHLDMLDQMETTTRYDETDDCSDCWVEAVEWASRPRAVTVSHFNEESAK